MLRAFWRNREPSCGCWCGRRVTCATLTAWRQTELSEICGTRLRLRRRFPAATWYFTLRRIIGCGCAGEIPTRCIARMSRALVLCSKLRENKAYGVSCTRLVWLPWALRSEEHTSELQSLRHLV